MKVIDFHLHISQAPDIDRELHILDWDINNQLTKLSARLKWAGIDKGMVFFLDERFLKDEQDLQDVKGLISSPKIDNLFFSIMLDFRAEDADQVLERALLCGIKGVKFHPIHQKISYQDYKRVKEIATLVDSKGLIITIDTHYVGFDCDDYSGLKLVRFILPHVKGPVVLAHAGGLKVLEALALALDFKNVYLDISFSIPFWLGSSIETDFMFAIKKVGSHRCIYGSDSPFIDLHLAKKSTKKFLIAHKFNAKERGDIFYNTANNLLQKRSRDEKISNCRCPS